MTCLCDTPHNLCSLLVLISTGQISAQGLLPWELPQLWANTFGDSQLNELHMLPGSAIRVQGFLQLFLPFISSSQEQTFWQL